MGVLITVTSLVIFIFGVLLIKHAWRLGGEFYTENNITKRKSWIKRLLDGFELLERM